jgi:hypothetical protein
LEAEIRILNGFYLAGLDSIFCHDWLTPRGGFCHAVVQVTYFKKVSFSFYPVVIAFDFIMDCFDHRYVFYFFFSFSIGDQKN